MNSFDETFTKLVDSYSELDLESKKEELFIRMSDLIEGLNGDKSIYNQETNKNFEHYLSNLYLLTFKLENTLSKYLIEDGDEIK